MQHTIWLGEISLSDKEQVGSKAYNLTLLDKIGCRIPDGFVILPSALDLFCEHNGLETLLTDPMHKNEMSQNQNQLLEKSHRVLEQFLNATWPDDLADELTKALESLFNLDDDLEVEAVAVRSSFSGEDGSVSSFAGQMETVLGVSNRKQLLDAVATCWASLWGTSSMSYRLTRGLSLDGQGGVLVQKEVNPDWSGVLFASNPLDHEAGMLMEAVDSQKDGVVSGSCLPHRIQINKEDSKQITYQAPDDTQNRISDNTLALLAKEASKVVQQSASEGLGDFEWVLAGKIFYLIQGRPLTGLSSEPYPQDDIIWSKTLGEEFWSGAVSPLMFSCIGETIERAMIEEPLSLLKDLRQSEQASLNLIHNHVYVNIDVVERVIERLPRWAMTEDVLRMLHSLCANITETLYPR